MNFIIASILIGWLCQWILTYGLNHTDIRTFHLDYYLHRNRFKNIILLSFFITAFLQSGRILYGLKRIGENTYRASIITCKHVDSILSPEVALRKLCLHLCQYRKNSQSHDPNKHGEHMLLLFCFPYTVSLKGGNYWAKLCGQV